LARAAVVEHLARPRPQDAGGEPRERRLAGTGGADDRDATAGVDAQREPVDERRPVAVVAEREVSQLERALQALRLPLDDRLQVRIRLALEHVVDERDLRAYDRELRADADERGERQQEAREQQLEGEQRPERHRAVEQLLRTEDDDETGRRGVERG